MFDPKKIDEIASRLADSMPPGLDAIRTDLEKNIRATLQGVLNKMDLVTREEFEVQKAVLAKTRLKLEALEQQLQALEEQMNQE
ncbi:MAG TPA: accessory factor UbiK family protein [Methylococcales bacterium]|jgi:BMFP domain-containing protein YqiC|nr:accessory factor UbiK family protein [Methylococcales bacterium]HIO12923.1 accessory factor UbiK family protein [Methylococcales bacterium]HIO45352.1 accessory factor UbiK family protein [Methylococcales bacterium]